MFAGFWLFIVAATSEHQDLEVSGYGSVGRYSVMPFACTGDPVPERRQAVNATASVKIPLSKTRPHALVASLTVQPDWKLFNGDLTAGEIAECEAIIDSYEEARFEGDAYTNDESTDGQADEEWSSLEHQAEMCERTLNRTYSSAWSNRTLVRPAIRYSFLRQKSGGRFVDVQIGLTGIISQINLRRGFDPMLPLGFVAPSFMLLSNAGRYFYVNLSFLAESQYPILPIARFGFGPRFGHVRMLFSAALAGAIALELPPARSIPLYGIYDLEWYSWHGVTLRTWVAVGGFDYYKRNWFSGGSLSYAFDPWEKDTEPVAPDVSDDAGVTPQ